MFTGGTTGYLGYGIFRGDGRTFSVTIAHRHGRQGAARADRRASGSTWRRRCCRRGSRGWRTGVVGADRADARDGEHDQPACAISSPTGSRWCWGTQAIGDALICTNPLYGRGCSLGGLHAKLLRDALRDHASADDYEALALRMHEDVRARDRAVVRGERDCRTRRLALRGRRDRRRSRARRRC